MMTKFILNAFSSKLKVLLCHEKNLKLSLWVKTVSNVGELA